MAAGPSYHRYREGLWRITAVSQSWTQDLRDRILELAERQPAAKHPQTLKLRHSGSGYGESLYLKVFHPSAGIAGFKDWCRASKARRAFRQGLALERAGFNVPTALAAGEARRGRNLARAFILTLEISGQPLPSFLRDCLDSNLGKLPWAKKRESVRRLAEQIGKLHRLGFVHGDLVPSNILIVENEKAGLQFYFMDNDRTRCYPRWLPQRLWKRNLIQLNRFPLPGITLQDRVRFFHFYIGRKKLTGRDKRWLQWLERKTRQRRRECDAADATMAFRQLMRWDERRVTSV